MEPANSLILPGVMYRYFEEKSTHPELAINLITHRDSSITKIEWETFSATAETFQKITKAFVFKEIKYPKITSDFEYFTGLIGANAFFISAAVFSRRYCSNLLTKILFINAIFYALLSVVSLVNRFELIAITLRMKQLNRKNGDKIKEFREKLNSIEVQEKVNILYKRLVS